MSVDTLECIQALQCVLWFVYKCACLWMYTHTHIYTLLQSTYDHFLSHITKSSPERVSHKQSEVLQDRHRSFSPVLTTALSLCLQLCGFKPSYFLAQGGTAGPWLWVQAGT